MAQSSNVNVSQALITLSLTLHDKKKSVTYAEILATPVPIRANSLLPKEISSTIDLN
jgi:hypothetical protein